MSKTAMAMRFARIANPIGVAMTGGEISLYGSDKRQNLITI